MTEVAYLAGPMRDHENFNFQVFEDASQDLALMGYKIVSPHQYDIDCQRVHATWHLEEPRDGHASPRRVFDEVTLSKSFDFETVMGDDLDLIQSLCDCIVLLPGWSESEGANRELTHAESLGLPAYYFDPEVRLLTALVA